MIINEKTKIIGRNVVLVPYRPIHVPKYHDWMASPELQKLTASEPLSLDEEYQMQESWRQDEDKLTFIILDKATFIKTGDEIESMIGDTNIFLTDPEDRSLAEIEIMIAESSYRGKGRGKEATLLMLKYGAEHLSISRYEAKIGLDNDNSIRLFEWIGFEETSRSSVFNEVTLSLAADDSRLLKHFADYIAHCTTEHH